MPASPAADTIAMSAPPPGSRRAEIALVAAEEFTRRGYHSTRVGHIAERLSVTPGALYRHVPGKYEIFRDAVLTLIADLDAASGDATAGDLGSLVTAVTETTMIHRARAALYRWQGRYLAPADRELVVRTAEDIRDRFEVAVRATRDSGSTGAGSASAATAIMSTIASLGDHRIELSTPDAVAWARTTAELLAGSRRTAPGLTAPAAGSASGPGASAGSGSGSGSDYGSGGETVPPGLRLRGGAATREAAITAAISRFHRDGYDDVSMETIGGDAGVAASALYRHFSGKSALLTAAVDRTAAFMEQTLDEHAALHSASDDPADALSNLLDGYVDIAFSHGPELMLYYSELGTLTTDDRQRLRDSQRRQLQRWTGLVRQALPGTDETTARLRVQAALAVALDGARGVGFHPAAAPRYGDLARIPLLGATQ